MSGSSRAPRILLAVGITFSIALIAAGLVADILVGRRLWWLQPTMLLGGLAWGLMAIRASTTMQCRVYLSLAAIVVSLLSAELLFRAIRFDFEGGRKRRYLATPIYFRQPTIPLAPVFFRRPGPQRWKGRVLYEGLKESGGDASVYADEAEIVVDYDRQGFRNRADLADWEIAIAGDSFVELGHLPFESIYTTIIADRLRTGVKNLGVSRTGAFTQISYLENMGVAKSVRHWVLVFYEGNDVTDISLEQEALDRFARDGEREYRAVPLDQPQTSLLTAVARAARSPRRRESQAASIRRSWVNCQVLVAGQPRPYTVSYAPPSRSQLSDLQRRALESSIAAFADSAGSRGIKPWLVYMPCKHRVSFPRLRMADSASDQLKHWKPNDLPKLIAELCGSHNIPFIDATPTLMAEQELTFNAVWDSHLNARGSRIVADLLVLALGAARAAPTDD